MCFSCLQMRVPACGWRYTEHKDRNSIKQARLYAKVTQLLKRLAKYPTIKATVMTPSIHAFFTAYEVSIRQELRT